MTLEEKRERAIRLHRELQAKIEAWEREEGRVDPTRLRTSRIIELILDAADEAKLDKEIAYYERELCRIRELEL